MPVALSKVTTATRAGPRRVPATAATTAGLAVTALRAGLVLMADRGRERAASSRWHWAPERWPRCRAASCIALACAGVVRTDVAARLLRPRAGSSRWPPSSALAGILDAGLYEHFGGIAGALGVHRRSRRRRLHQVRAVPGGVATAGVLCALALDGHTLGVDGRATAATSSQEAARQLRRERGRRRARWSPCFGRFLASAPQRLGRRARRRPLADAAARARGRRPPRSRCCRPPNPAGTRSLRSRAASAMSWRCWPRGRVPKQAAHDLSIALATVRSRIASAKRKTGARTLDQLVADVLRPRPDARRRSPAEARLAA